MVVNPRHPYHLLANSMVWLVRIDIREPPAASRCPPGSKNSPTSRRHEHGTQHASTRRSSSEPASPASAPQSAWPKPASTTSSSSNAADRVGGTWRDTTYPGASCDIPSLLYSFSFVKNPTWSRTYSPAAEICRHIEDMATRFDIRRHIRFGHEVTGLTFDEDAGVWTATTRTANASRPHRGPGLRPAVRRQLPGHPRHRQLPGSQDPQRPLGPRLRLHRQARRRHRHRRQRDPDHPRTGQAGRLRQGLPAHAGLGAAPRRHRHSAGRPGAVRQSPCHPTACPAGAVLGPRGQRDGAGVEHPADVAGRPAGPSPPARAGQRPVAAPPADARLSRRAASAC